MPKFVAVFAVLLASFSWPVYSKDRVVESDAHRFQEVAPDVWLATGTGSVHTQSNSMVVVGANDTVVVDSHVTPTAARALIASIRLLTDKPVRYLVNTHYHFDHAHGNQAFPSDVEIIGHEYTRAKLNLEIGNVLQERTFRGFTDRVPGVVARLERRAESATDPVEKAELLERARVQRDYMNAIPEIRPTPPNITLDRKLTIYQDLDEGTREIQLWHFGRAHTGGDVVIFLPEERIVYTGDVMLPRLAYMGDAFVEDWPATLDGLMNLDFDVWVPGHGDFQRGKSMIPHFQAYLRDILSRTIELHRKGLSWEEAAKQIDMTDHAKNFPRHIKGLGADPRAIRRIYERLDAGELSE